MPAIILPHALMVSSEKVGTTLKRTPVLISGLLVQAARTDAKCVSFWSQIRARACLRARMCLCARCGRCACARVCIQAARLRWVECAAACAVRWAVERRCADSAARWRLRRCALLYEAVASGRRGCLQCHTAIRRARLSSACCGALVRACLCARTESACAHASARRIPSGGRCGRPG